MKKILFFVLMIVGFFACTSDEDTQYADNYYTEQAQKLAKDYGFILNLDDSYIMTETEYKKIKDLVDKVKDFANKPIVLSFVEVEEGGKVVFSNKPLKTIVKTRSESMSASVDWFTITVSVNTSNMAYVISYKVDPCENCNSTSLSVDSEKKNIDENGIMHFITKVTVWCNRIGIPYYIVGTFDTEKGNGSISISKENPEKKKEK